MTSIKTVLFFKRPSFFPYFRGIVTDEGESRIKPCRQAAMDFPTYPQCGQGFTGNTSGVNVTRKTNI